VALAAAERTVAMIESNTVKRCRALLAAPEHCDRVESVVKPLRDAGKCTVVSPEGDGDDRLVATLQCGAMRRRLTIGVSDKDPTKLSTLLFAPQKEAANRCTE